MPRLNAHSDARDGHATSSDIRTRHPALVPRVYASACTDLRGNAMRRGSAIRKGQKFLVIRTTNERLKSAVSRVGSNFSRIGEVLKVAYESFLSDILVYYLAS